MAGGGHDRTVVPHDDDETYSCRMVDDVGAGGCRGVRSPEGRMATCGRAKVWQKQRRDVGAGCRVVKE